MPLVQIEDMRSKPRRASVVCRVGGVAMGGHHPVVVQSMTNTETADAASQLASQARELQELIRMFRL